jgi:nuclear pore complex protein Nup133
VESLPQATGERAGTGGGLGASTSLLVLHQLEDKLRCHEFLVAFLKMCGLWGRLAALTVRGRPMATVLCLAEAAEKNVAAIALRTIHAEHAVLMDAATRITLSEREVTAAGNLTVQDHFYREISRIDELLDGFVAYLAHCIRSDSPRELYANVTSINAVVVTMFREVLTSRNKKAAEFTPSGLAAQLEYLPWTAARREQLLQLAKQSLQYGLPAAENAAQRVRLQQQVTDLADIVLDGYRSQVASLVGEKREEVSRQMERDRDQLIGPLVDRKLYEEAASLAEKYLDFDSLGNDAALWHGVDTCDTGTLPLISLTWLKRCIM